MLASQYRLRRPREINRVYTKGRSVSAGPVGLRVLSTGRPESRVAIVVSKKISKKAVIRNRIRRRIAELLAAKWQTVAPGYDIVVGVRADVSEAPAAQLKAHIESALSKAGLT